MIPAYNKKRCAAVPFETGIHSRRKTDFFPEEDTTKSYSGFEPEPTRLQAEGSSGQAMVLPQKDWVPGDHGALLRGIAICDARGVKPELIGGRSGDLLCFLMKTASASDGRVLVRRRPGEHMRSNCLWPRHTGTTLGAI
ncbi:hypothetical protein TNCV_1349711 [Trichonephila clavipes]|nr:hypothetical protein TNCV_1349711 [Trichonephila clavipes]